jgi:glycosyltransferase involved in cell wall biosynthesis
LRLLPSNSEAHKFNGGVYEFKVKIGIDARLVTYRRGIGNFVYHLLTALRELEAEHSFILYVDNPKAIEVVPNDSRFVVKQLGPRLDPCWEQISLPLMVARDQLDILHSPANTAPIYLPARTKLVLTIHDVMYLLPTQVLPPPPSLYHRLGRQYRRLVVPCVARQAAAIITDSNYSRQDIVKHLHLDVTQIEVVGGAANYACRIITQAETLATVRAKYALNSPFILALGAVDPRKNTARIMEAYERFRRRTSARYQLVLLGLPSTGQAQFRQLAQQLDIVDDVVLAGFVPEDNLVALYNAAELFVYPSLYEGFGLPILEAMTCGTPVITSPRGSLPEIAGDAAFMVDPLNVETIADGLWRVINDSTLRQELIVRGHIQTQKFSWRQAALQTLEIYQRIGDG